MSICMTNEQTWTEMIEQIYYLIKHLEKGTSPDSSPLNIFVFLSRIQFFPKSRFKKGGEFLKIKFFQKKNLYIKIEFYRIE